MSLLWIVPLLVLLAAGAFVVAVHWGFRAPRHVETQTPDDVAIPRWEEVWIPTLKGRRLCGWWIPGRRADRVILLMHGWGGNMEKMLPIALPLHMAGYSLLLVDARNHGRSDSDGVSSLPLFATDVESAIDWLRGREESREARIALLGHSLGGAAVLLAASARDDISAVVSVASFAHPEEMTRRYVKRVPLPHLLEGAVLRYAEWAIGDQFDRIAPLTVVCRIRCPVLLVHGERDATVPVEDAYRIHDACPDHPPQLLIIPGAGHNATRELIPRVSQLLDFLDRAGMENKP